MTAELQADVVVIGGGPAGLAAAVALSRSRRNVVLVDAGKPRNAPADGAHNVLGHEGIPPQDLLARGRYEAEAYGVRIVSGVATGAYGVLDDFTIKVNSGAVQVRARRVILATGLVDALPTIPGVAEAWGHSVLHCPFCHGVGTELGKDWPGILSTSSRPPKRGAFRHCPRAVVFCATQARLRTANPS